MSIYTGWWTGSTPTRCALRAVAQQLLRPSTGHQDSGEAMVPAAESLLADEPVRDFSFIGLFNGAPDRAERSEDILREPMLIDDNGPLVAMLNAKDKHHESLDRVVPVVPRPDYRPAPADPAPSS